MGAEVSCLDKEDMVMMGHCNIGCVPACAMVMRTDFEYWELDELDLEPCCALKFYPNIEICNTQIEGDIQVSLPLS